MQIELKRIQQQVGITFVYVTHDQEEALTMSDTVVVMNEGRIQQIGTPQDIYNEPKNAFVADFIGESNIIDGIMHEDRVVGMYGKKFPCLDGGFQPTSLWMWSSARRTSTLSPWSRASSPALSPRSPSRGCITTSSWTSRASSAHPDHRLLPSGGQDWGEDRPRRLPHHEEEPLLRYVRRTTAPTAQSTTS